jgi:hypothetical protein
MDSDAEDDDDDDEQLESRTRGRHLADIDMESIGSTNGDGIEHPERRACTHCANIDTDQSSSDGIDTESSDPAENAEADTDDEQPESYSCGRHLDDIDTESVCAVGDHHIDTDVAGSDYSDDDTESSDTGGDDARNSDGGFPAASRPPTAPHLFFPNRAGASMAASLPPTAPHLFFLNRAGASTVASRPPTAPHLYFRNRAD